MTRKGMSAYTLDDGFGSMLLKKDFGGFAGKD
jgi:hypothetical protein